MIKFGKSVENSIFREVTEFFRDSSKVIEHDAPDPPTPGFNPVHASGSGASTRLSAIYGNRLRITGNGPTVEQHLRDLECFPDSFHEKLLGYFTSHPKGGIDIVDGPATDVMPHLRGVTPRGWPPEKTWDEVPGIHSPATHRVVLGASGSHGSVSLAAHESGHAFSRAIGTASDSAEFRQIYDKMDTKNPYYAAPDGAGRSETFAEGIAAWAKNRHMSPECRADAIANALDLRGDKQAQGALLDNYFSSLEHDLEPHPL